MEVETLIGLIMANILCFIVLYCNYAYPGVETETRGDVIVHYACPDENGDILALSDLKKIVLILISSNCMVILARYLGFIPI